MSTKQQDDFDRALRHFKYAIITFGIVVTANLLLLLWRIITHH